MIKTKSNFKTASDAFDYFYVKIKDKGIDYDNTKALFNIGFYIHNPLDMNIKANYRGFNEEYAEAEWKWYCTNNPSIDALGEIHGSIPPIWETMADSKREVRSNYGWQWERGHQLDKVVAMLKHNKDTRQAAISIYDGKEIDTYAKDTPCTYAIQFTIVNNKLEMSVLMRSNDLWYGFCNDQYCFASLQKEVSERLSIKVGSYYHFAHNLHLYNDKIN